MGFFSATLRGMLQAIIALKDTKGRASGKSWRWKQFTGLMAGRLVAGYLFNWQS